MDQIVIYQAGGMHKHMFDEKLQHWQEYVRSRVPENKLIRYHVPYRNRNVEGVEHLPFGAYSALDKWYASKAHIVFAYLEQTNPGGHGAIFEVALQEGTRPHGLRIVVNEDSHNPEDLKSGDVRRYRQAIEWGAHPANYYPTLEEGVHFLETILHPFRIPEQHVPAFILLIGDTDFSIRVHEKLSPDSYCIVHYLDDFRFGYNNHLERATALRFYAQCADIVAVDFNSLAHPKEKWLRDLAFEIIGTLPLPQKLVTACAGVAVGHEITCRIPYVFTETDHMIGYIKTALRQFGYPS